MKELSTEQKAQRYDEALKKAKDFYKGYKQRDNQLYADDLESIFPELKESEDENVRKSIIAILNNYVDNSNTFKPKMIAWLEKQGEQKPILPKWKYKKDNTPLLRDSIILNKYGCVTKSPSGALVSDVWVMDYDELAKLPKEDFEKQNEQKPAEWSEDNLPEFESYLCLMFQNFRTKGICTNGEIIDFVNEHSQKLKDILCHAWSEEDEKKLTKTLVILNDAYASKGLLNWVESLKDRVQLQNK